jgi:hypothetical protein
MAYGNLSKIPLSEKVLGVVIQGYKVGKVALALLLIGTILILAAFSMGAGLKIPQPRDGAALPPLAEGAGATCTAAECHKPISDRGERRTFRCRIELPGSPRQLMVRSSPLAEPRIERCKISNCAAGISGASMPTRETT